MASQKVRPAALRWFFMTSTYLTPVKNHQALEDEIFA